MKIYKAIHRYDRCRYLTDTVALYDYLTVEMLIVPQGCLVEHLQTRDFSSEEVLRDMNSGHIMIIPATDLISFFQLQP